MIFNTNKLTIWALITSCLLIVGMGHGAVPIIMAELLIIFNPDYWQSIFNLEDSGYNRMVVIFSLIWMISQVLLYISYRKKLNVLQFIVVLMFWADLFYLSDSFTFTTAAPCVMISFVLTAQIIYNRVNRIVQ